MEFGAQLRGVFRLKLGLALSLVVAALATVLSQFHVSVLPPSLHLRDYEIAGASTQLLIDTHDTKLTDLKATYVDFASLVSRADLLGNLMVSQPVLDRTGEILGIPGSAIHGDAPITADVPRTLVEPRSGQAAFDLIASPNEYKLQIQANPSVPYLNVYTQAPSADRAVDLANASIVALREHLDEIAEQRGIPPEVRVHLRQFGGAHGGTVNPGAGIQIAALTFGVAFMLMLALVVAADRIRRGWRAAALREKQPA